MALEFRTGVGYDSHRFTEGRALILGGVRVPHDRGLAGHSDADIVLHALTDALLGAIAQGDIGTHFPPSDPQWKDAASTRFLAHAVGLARDQGYTVVNADCVVVLQRPKLAPHREAIRSSVAAILGVELDRIGFKAKTAEGLGPVGEEQGAECHAVVTVRRDG